MSEKIAFTPQTISNFPSLAAAFYDIAFTVPDRVVYRQAQISDGDQESLPRSWSSRTYGEVRDRVKRMAHYLKSLGVKRGDRVAILSSSRPEWMESDLAALTLGGVVVSIYQSLPAEDVGYILFDSGADVVFAENQEQVDKLLELLGGPIPIPGTEERDETQAQIGIRKIIAFEEVRVHALVSQYDGIVREGETADLETYQGLNKEDLAALVYTSGTTGPPKGVMQTHGNHLANVRQAWESSLCGHDSSIMLFLPLAHSFAKLMGYLGFLTPASVCFPGVADKKTSKIAPESVTKDIREAGATIVPVVPRLLEKMQAGVEQKKNAPGLAGAIIRLVLWGAGEVYQAKQLGKGPSILAMIAYQGTAGIRAKIRAKLFGENFRYCISGGAKLNPQTGRFFDALGIEILEGYGLTETCVATNVNRFGSKKIGSVGPVLADDIKLRIAEDGEILYRGPNIAKGYYNREAATKASWDDDGWFHTGDLGAVDQDGYLSIVGRKKEILVTSYGKNIAPEDIEASIKSTPYVSQVVLLGDGRPYITALVTVDVPAVEAWAKKMGITEPVSTLVQGTRVRDLIWKDIEKINEDLAHHESIKKIAIAPEEFTVENGILTPTFKVKRRVVMEQYGEMIEGMYSS
ncbi:MAG: long-chain fatty acid--CoA ligase [Bdellovibrionales bacterium]|nr:long-chain fatty acid--CoA ligase [Bdellovibrionales bacterium]